MFNITTAAVVHDDVFNAPFIGCSTHDRNNLIRLGAIDTDDNPRESLVDMLANAFAALFMGFCVCQYKDDEGEILFIHETLSGLVEKKEFTAAYLYLVLRCGVYNGASINQDLILIAQREDLLKIYMVCFTGAFGKFVDVIDSIISEVK